MQTIHRSLFIKKTINVLLVYVLLLDTLVPSLHAMHSLSFPGSLRSGFTSARQTGIFAGNATDDMHLLTEQEAWKEAAAGPVALYAPASVSSVGAQPEVSGFSIGSTDGMVDKFTGDFSYSIPLVDAEGYPITLAYNSNVSMLQEASWVGLGWDLNVGSIARDMRGIPDEFNGDDVIVREFKQEDVEVAGSKNGGYVDVLFKLKSNAVEELANKSGVKLGINVSFLAGKYENNYLGTGKTYDLDLRGSARYSIASDALFLSPTVNLGMSYDSKNGIGSTYGLGLKATNNTGVSSSAEGQVSYGRTKNSRYGMEQQSLSFNAGLNFAKKGEVASSTSAFTYGTATSLPKVQFNSATDSYDFEMDFYGGAGAAGVIIKAGYLRQNYTSTSKLLYNLSTDKKIYHPAYGYFHSGKRKFYIGADFPMMDFNRGVENEYSEEMRTLPSSVQTHDVFYVNAMGINGTFRGMRTDYGTYYDPDSESTYNSESELLSNADVSTLAIGVIYNTPTFQFGIAASTGTMKANQNSGNWNEGTNLLEFVSQGPSSSFDQTVYFKPMGSVTPVDMQPWEQVNGNTADYFDINVVGGNIQQENYLKVKDDNVLHSDLNSFHNRTHSEIYFKPNTVAELTGLGVPASVSRYTSVSPSGTADLINRLDANKKGNHISSIDAVTPNGVRYQYGIPVYSYEKSEVTFSCEGRPELVENHIPSGIIKYEANDNSIANGLSVRKYFDKTTLPPYAQAFLLTQVVSSDYIDRTNNGPTLDDVGNYYKFNHTRVYGPDNLYGTRFPVSGTDTSVKKAFYAKGALGTDRDNLANYTYQTSEIWYTHSLETKNLIVEFHLDDRKDAYSTDENGILQSGKPMKCLSEIVVYNRLERSMNPNAVPLQTIRFYYDYSLCQKSPGNLNTYTTSGQPSGKLTLREVRVFNGNSYENALSSIRFEYASGAENPAFSYANIDGWGQYKPNTTLKPNDVYPYASQNAAAANLSAKAWKLVAIDNPMGGRIEIDYESDSYGYVQDRRAMRNFDVHRMTDLFDFLKIRKNAQWDGTKRASGDDMEQTFHHDYGSVSTLLSENGVPAGLEGMISKAIFKKNPNSLYNATFGRFDINLVPNNVIIFKLDQPLNGGFSQDDADKLVADWYFRDPNDPSKEAIQELYTRMYVTIKDGVVDLVPAMSTVSKRYIQAFSNNFLGHLPEYFPSYGAMPRNPATGNYEYGFVVVDPVHTGAREEKGIDRIKKGSVSIHPMQLAALEYARATLVDKVYGSDPGSEGDMSIDWKVFFGNDMYKYMISSGGYCADFDGARSLMRLNEPDYTKYGGGARVKEIRYFDNWQDISGEYNSRYSWKYKYTTTINREEYSTGVAAFEPMTIIDENPFNNWIKYVNIHKKFPDENKFVPGPVDYQLFPKPVIGYEKVEVTFIEAGNYGKSTSLYYTAKDYPTVSNSTTIDKSAKVSKNNIITGKVRDFYGITQGYVTETNDFHGKIRLTEVSKKNQQNEDITISKSVYQYYGKGEQLKMADRAGAVGMYHTALEYDIHADSRYYTDENQFFKVGLDFVLNWTPPLGFAPIFKPIFSTGSRERAFYSHTLVKHINYSAVLKAVTTEYLGSVNTTRHNVFDLHTGAPVVSELTDEYNDRLYQVNYPAHWKYKELRELHGTAGKTVVINLGGDGYFTPSPSNANDALTPGDIVLIDGYELQVAQNWPWPEDGKLFLLAVSDGNIYVPNSPGNRNATIIQSARDNRLLETMQGFTTKVNPVAGSVLFCPKEHVLSASAITYRDRLTNDCFCNNLTVGNESYNPYKSGMRGDLVLDRQFSWQSERANDDPHGIRFDGAYRSGTPSDPHFVLFYERNTAGKWVPVYSSGHPDHASSKPYRNWRPLGNATLYDRYANTIESKDQINVYSSILTGYGSAYNSLVVAQAVNARRQQIAFDGFEDYESPIADIRCRSAIGDNSHFDFFRVTLTPENGVSVDNSVKHSGLHSLKVNGGKKASVTKTISPSCSPVESADVVIGKGLGLDSCACLPTFSPTPGKYIIGAWVKGNEGTSLIEVSLTGGGSFSFYPEGPEIDGWRRIEGEFTVPSGATSITVHLKNTHPSSASFFDDVRIHPFLAGMQTTVYDPETFLPLATHDGYNFTTYYNYDENLNLVRIRVETVDGIKTITESESATQKSYPTE